ncbi:MAG: DUF2892 domain-containing protein [Flavobacteriaceae bacterium]
MKKNIGALDKVLRFLLGITGGLLVYYEVLTGPTSFIVLTAVAVLFLTALTGFCPLYGLLGIHTCRTRY